MSALRLTWRWSSRQCSWRADCHGYTLASYELSDGWHVEIDRVTAASTTNVVRRGACDTADAAKQWAEQRFARYVHHESRRLARIRRVFRTNNEQR
jgi:hypothetical protein